MVDPADVSYDQQYDGLSKGGVLSFRRERPKVHTHQICVLVEQVKPSRLRRRS